jgi:hypothetical protein
MINLGNAAALSNRIELRANLFRKKISLERPADSGHDFT